MSVERDSGRTHCFQDVRVPVDQSRALERIEELEELIRRCPTCPTERRPPSHLGWHVSSRPRIGLNVSAQLRNVMSPGPRTSKGVCTDYLPRARLCAHCGLAVRNQLTRSLGLVVDVAQQSGRRVAVANKEEARVRFVRCVRSRVAAFRQIR